MHFILYCLSLHNKLKNKLKDSVKEKKLIPIVENLTYK